MQHTLEQIRTRLIRWVNGHASRESSKTFKESILLKDGCLHGYRFCIGSVEAIWVVGEVTVEVRRDGRLTDTLTITDQASEHDQSQRAA